MAVTTTTVRTASEGTGVVSPRRCHTSSIQNDERPLPIRSERATDRSGTAGRTTTSPTPKPKTRRAMRVVCCCWSRRDAKRNGRYEKSTLVYIYLSIYYHFVWYYGTYFYGQCRGSLFYSRAMFGFPWGLLWLVKQFLPSPSPVWSNRVRRVESVESSPSSSQSGANSSN